MPAQSPTVADRGYYSSEEILTCHHGPPSSRCCRQIARRSSCERSAGAQWHLLGPAFRRTMARSAGLLWPRKATDRFMARSHLWLYGREDVLLLWGGTVMPVRLRATKTMGRSCAARQAYLTFAAFAVLVAYQPAEGQESSQLPTLERQQPGVAEGIPNDVLPPSDAPSVDELSASLIGQALGILFKDSVPHPEQKTSILQSQPKKFELSWQIPRATCKLRISALRQR